MAVTIGKKAPSIKLLNQDEESISLSDFQGKRVLLYFYPRALTPGCTTQACSLQEHLSDFKKLKSIILAVSPDTPDKLKKFSEKYQLTFPLLSDPNHEVAKKYEVYGEKTFMGKKHMGIIRTSFIIDKDGAIEWISGKVNTKTHHQTVLDYLSQT